MTSPFPAMLRNRAAAAAVALCSAMPVAGLAQTPATPGMDDAPCAGVPALPAVPRALADLFIAPGPLDPAKLQPLLTGPVMVERARLEAAQREQDWPGLCRYAADNAAVVAAATTVDGVFLGDSITELWNDSKSTVFDTRLLNRGIAGQTTPQILVRFMADVVALHPRFVHILAGTNDIAGNTGPTSAQRYRDNIGAMVALARQHHLRVLLASIPPAASMPWRPHPGTPARIAALNGWLRDLAQREGLVYVDYHAVLAAPDGSFRAELSNDGVHPNDLGYARMKTVLAAALARLDQ